MWVGLGFYLALGGLLMLFFHSHHTADSAKLSSWEWGLAVLTWPIILGWFVVMVIRTAIQGFYNARH